MDCHLRTTRTSPGSRLVRRATIRSASADIFPGRMVDAVHNKLLFGRRQTRPTYRTNYQLGLDTRTPARNRGGVDREYRHPVSVGADQPRISSLASRQDRAVLGDVNDQFPCWGSTSTTGPVELNRGPGQRRLELPERRAVQVSGTHPCKIRGTQKAEPASSGQDRWTSSGSR